jgi:hypothetical protein
MGYGKDSIENAVIKGRNIIRDNQFTGECIGLF